MLPDEARSSLLWAQPVLLLWVTLGKQGKENNVCQLQNEPIRKAVLLPSVLRGHGKQRRWKPAFHIRSPFGSVGSGGSSGSKDLVALKETLFLLACLLSSRVTGPVPSAP